MNTVLALAIICIGAPVAAGAQTPVRSHLNNPTGTLAEEFTSIDYLRELPDGRILVADANEPRLVIADLHDGSVKPVAHVGSGPGEYRSIDGLFALGGDSTLLLDGMNRRWLILAGAHVVATVAPTVPAVVASRRGERGTDRAGRVLAQLNAGGIVGDRLGRLDSPYVALVDRRTGKADTIARIRPILRLQVDATLGSDGHLSSARYIVPPFSAFEQLALFPDGWLAIARLDPYRVEWRSADGRWTRGAPVPVVMVRVDDRQKRAYMARTFVGPNALRDPNAITNWPALLPAFEGRPEPILVAASDGSVLVRRVPTATDSDAVYDVFNRRGVRVRQLALPANRRIVGFGARAVYLAVADADGIERVARYPWP